MNIKALIPGNPGPSRGTAEPGQVLALRELFWHNVVREMLTSLSMMQPSQPELFDGRTAILTYAGERIAIAEIYPLFACAIPGTPIERESSVAVECTVFRVRTPEGEVFTLPVHQVRAVHSLTPELMQELEQAAMAARSGPDQPPGPFGFAAFTGNQAGPGGAGGSSGAAAGPSPHR